MYAAPETRNGAPPAFLLTVTPASDGSGEFAIITAPQRVYLVPGIEIRVDKRRPFKALFELCDDAGCHAGFKLAGPVLDAFRRGAAAKVRIWTAKDKAVEFAVSLNGFSKALEGLKRGGKP
ncbi:invasion associated locus B family protein [Sinorhizobium meliloti]|nr:invasion associated locus B family protein [Sinorhizobium meliloti]